MSEFPKRPSPEGPSGAAYPRTRMRRPRMQAWSRRLTAETVLTPADFILPAFVHGLGGGPQPIASMPGVFRHDLETIVELAGEAISLGIPALALFPYGEPKSDDAAAATSPDNLACRAVRAIKKVHPQIGLICDVALDPYTSSGHDGILIDGDIANDETVSILARQSVVLADAGADVVAPSDMMDGRVGAIRSALDLAGFDKTQIMAYSAKYASAFYGPFRDAVGAIAGLGKEGKLTYQMSPSNGDEALREVALDLAEGADMIMVKPGLPYLDVLHRVKAEFRVPTFAYHVSGEYAMWRAAADNGWIDGPAALMETLMGFKRAGADGILTYGALEAARILRVG